MSFFSTLSSSLFPPLLISSVALSSSLYALRFVSIRPKGLSRVFWALPVFTAYLMLPRGIDAAKNPVLSIILTTFFSWWANFKILALCWNRGPLANFRQKKSKETLIFDFSKDFFSKESFVLYCQFSAFLILPIVILPPEKVRAPKVRSFEAEKTKKIRPIFDDSSSGLRENKIIEKGQNDEIGGKPKIDILQFGDLAFEKVIKGMGAPMRLVLGDLSGETKTERERFSKRASGLKEEEEKKTKEEEEEEDKEEEVEEEGEKKEKKEAEEEEEEEEEEKGKEKKQKEAGEKREEFDVSLTKTRSEIIRDSFVKGNDSWQFLALQALGSLILFSFLIYLTDLRIWMSNISLSLLYCLIMYNNLLYMFNFSAAIMKGTWGVSLAPDFKRPYFSSSLQDFWSRRWNLVAGQLLRDAVYSPLKQFLLEIVKEKSGFPKYICIAMATLATFFVSGTMHELILYNACGHLNGLSLEWLSFFSLHGILVVLEVGLKKAWVQKGYKKFPSVFSTPLTLLILVSTAQVYFFPPVMRHDFDRFAVGEFRKLLPGKPFESFDIQMTSLRKEEF